MATVSSFHYDGKVRDGFSPTARFAGFLLLAVGAFAFIWSLIKIVSSDVTLAQLAAGPAVLLVGYLMVSSYEGITLDAQTRRYRNYNWTLGFRQGEWLALPNVVGVTVSPFNAAYVLNNSIAPSATVQRHGLYRVLLSLENSRIGIIAAIEKQDSALQKAAQLEQLFGVELKSTIKI